MADTKLTALTALTAPISSDLLYIVDDPGGTPISKKITLADLAKGFMTGIFGGQSVTGSGSDTLIAMETTWNTTGTPTAIDLNVTNTASNAASLLMSLRVGGAAQLAVARGGNLRVGSGVHATAYGISVSDFANGIFVSMDGVSYQIAKDGAYATAGCSSPSYYGLKHQSGADAASNAHGWIFDLARWGVSNTTGRFMSFQRAGAEIAALTTIGGLLLGAATTAGASLNIPSGTAPTSPTNGDIWSDGSDLKVRLGGVTYTLTKA